MFRVLVSKAGWERGTARAAILGWSDAFETMETSANVMLAAADLSVHRKIGIWDAVILCASEAAGCRLLPSEDMQDVFTYKGTTATNPFASTRHPLLQAVLNAKK